MLLIEAAKEVMRKILNHGECYMVGGAVRDILLNIPYHDIDLVTNVPMETLESMFDTVDIGKNKEFGLIVVQYEGYTFEVANYRTDVYTGETSGKGANTVNIASSLKEDVMRRDFTINGLAMDIDDNIIDYVDGVNDLKNRKLRAIGAPNIRFAEDYIRMMRAIRFAAKMTIFVDPETWTHIINASDNITNVSMERISQELIKAADLSGKKFEHYIHLLKASGLLRHILPEVNCYDEYDHSPEHHPEGNVWEHTLACLAEYGDRTSVEVNLSILFHDVGKPVTYSIGEDGLIHYYNHSKDGLAIIDQIAERLRFSNDLRDCIKFSCENHMRMHFICHKDNRGKLVDLMHSPHFQTLLLVCECDTKSRLHAFDEKEWNRVKEEVLEMVRLYGPDPLKTIRSVVTGDLVMDICKFTKPGKAVGKIIAMVVRRIARNHLPISPDYMTVHDMKTVINWIKESRTTITGVKD